MFDKILVLGGILLGSILVIENMVIGLYGYFFLDPSVSVGVIILIGIFIGMAIGYGGNNIINNKKNSYNEDDDYEF